MAGKIGVRKAIELQGDDSDSSGAVVSLKAVPFRLRAYGYYFEVGKEPDHEKSGKTGAATTDGPVS